MASFPSSQPRDYLAEALAKATRPRESAFPSSATEPYSHIADGAAAGTPDMTTGSRGSNGRSSLYLSDGPPKGRATVLSKRRAGSSRVDRIPTKTLLQVSLFPEGPWNGKSKDVRIPASSLDSDEMAVLQTENDRLQRECDQKALQIIQLRNREQTLLTDVAHLQNELRLESARSRISLLDQVMLVNELQATQEPLAEHVARLERALSDSRAQVATLEAELSTAIVQTESLARHTSDARARSPFVLGDTARVQALLAESSSWQDKYTELEKKYEALVETQNGDADDRVKALEQLLDAEIAARKGAQEEAEIRLGRIAELEFSLLEKSSNSPVVEKDDVHDDALAKSGSSGVLIRAEVTETRSLHNAENTINILKHRIDNLQEVNGLLEVERTQLSQANTQAREQIALLEETLESSHQQHVMISSDKNSLIEELRAQLDARATFDEHASSDHTSDIVQSLQADRDQLSREVANQREYLRQWSLRYQEVVQAREADLLEIQKLHTLINSSDIEDSASNYSYGDDGPDMAKNGPSRITTLSAKIGDLDRNLRRIHDLEEKNRQKSEQLRLAEREIERLKEASPSVLVPSVHHSEPDQREPRTPMTEHGVSQHRSVQAMVNTASTAYSDQIAQLENELASQRQLNHHLKGHVKSLELKLQSYQKQQPVRLSPDDHTDKDRSSSTGTQDNVDPYQLDEAVFEHMERALHHSSPRPPKGEESIDDSDGQALSMYARALDHKFRGVEIERDCFIQRCKDLEREYNSYRSSVEEVGTFCSGAKELYNAMTASLSSLDASEIQATLTQFVNRTSTPEADDLLKTSEVSLLVCDLICDVGRAYLRLMSLMRESGDTLHLAREILLLNVDHARFSGTGQPEPRVRDLLNSEIASLLSVSAQPQSSNRSGALDRVYRAVQENIHRLIVHIGEIQMRANGAQARPCYLPVSADLGGLSQPPPLASSIDQSTVAMVAQVHSGVSFSRLSRGLAPPWPV